MPRNTLSLSTFNAVAATSTQKSPIVAGEPSTAARRGEVTGSSRE